MVVALLTFAVLVVTLMSCVSDIRTLRIPNSYVIAVAAFFIVAYAWDPGAFGRWWEHLGALVAIFVITYVMFCLGMMGGGDAKMGSALALWVGLKGILPYVIYMGIAGGVVGVLSLFFRKKKLFRNPRPGSWIAVVQDGGNAVPYGIAISIGAWAGLFHTGFLPQQLHELIKTIH